jgi:hypothetical protein
MRVAIICETSATVRDAFRARGHLAVSVDVLPSDRGADDPHHVQADAAEFLLAQLAAGRRFDLIIAHPPCTALCVSGNHVYAAGKPKHGQRLAAIQWTEQLWTLALAVSAQVCFENPVGILATQSRVMPRPSYVQPYDFGEDASKKTALYLHNLHPLAPTCHVPGRITATGAERWSNQTDGGQNRLGPSPDRWKLRSATYPGIAQAMAEQWGGAFVDQEVRPRGARTAQRG